MEMFNGGNGKIMDVTNFPVGLLQRQGEIEKLLHCHRPAPRLGLWGMGGVGKTTFVKSIYNRMHKGFESAAFILDIRTNVASSSSGLLYLQQKILDNLMPKECQGVKINDVDHGKRLLSYKLKGLTAFIVLDDLDTKSQIDALYYPLSSLGHESIVVITSRDRHILNYALIPEENIYPIERLSQEDSERLFCWHAFMNPVLPELWKEVSRKVINACQGLPLSLKVLGSHLYGVTDIDVWEEILHLIKQDESSIFDVLEVSLKSLTPSQKEAFLDICCFFIGKEEDSVSAFLEGCYGMGKTILAALKSKCLITVEARTISTTEQIRKIQVHDQLRDMGRYVILKGTKNRTWDLKSTNNILKDASARFGLWGLSAGPDMQILDEVASYKSIPQLRILEVERRSILNESRSFEDNSVEIFFQNVRCDELRWLRWTGPTLHPGLCSTHLRVLDLSHSKIRDLPRSLPNLQILELAGCEYMCKFENAMPLLRRLNMSQCKQLTTFNSMLPNLQVLELKDCRGFKRFSTPIGNSVPLLRVLNLGGCQRLESLDNSIGELTSLRYLSLKCCGNMTSLPEEMKNLSSLQALDLTQNDNVKTLSLPRSLQELELSLCSSLESVDCSLPNLQIFFLGGCPKLKKLPTLGGSLLDLKIWNCNELECLEPTNQASFFTDLSSLQKLQLGRCDSLRSLECLPANLQELHVYECKELRSVNFAMVANLRTLNLPGCLHFLNDRADRDRLRGSTVLSHQSCAYFYIAGHTNPRANAFSIFQIFPL